jgi:hypothetical protein
MRRAAVDIRAEVVVVTPVAEATVEAAIDRSKYLRRSKLME